MRHLDHRSSRCLLFLSAFGVLLAGTACEDLTAPRTPTRPAVGTTALAGSGPVLVFPGEMHGWTFVHAITGKPCVDSAECRLVSGPSTPPLGGGSAELASSNGVETSMALTEFTGVRLDHISSLRYSTYRQSGDRENDAAVTLQLTVKFDLADTSSGEVGHFVYEPYRGAEGGVPQNVWQGWNARDGLWWSDRQAPQSTHGADAHPCVAARPCSWSELLARFPNAGIHPTRGGVMLTARRGDGFRGNVDSLVVGIDGKDRVYDFEAEAPKVNYVLHAEIGPDVVTPSWVTDSSYRSGARVSYAFASRAGHYAPSVILDDTIAAASGEIVMDRPHTLVAESDTMYTYEALRPMEKSYADLMRTLMTSDYKVAAEQNLLEFTAHSLDAGASPDSVARAAKVASYVVMNPVRDSAALRAIDEALVGYNFYFRHGSFGTYVQPQYGPPRGRSFTKGAESPDVRAATDSAGPAVRRAAASVRGSLAPSEGRKSSQWQDGSFKDENFPPEKTVIIYTNGVTNLDADANVSSTFLDRLVRNQATFADQRYTTVTYSYNRTWTVQMQEYVAAHPCEVQAQVTLTMQSPALTHAQYEVCMLKLAGHAISSFDATELLTASVETLLHLAPSNEDVGKLADLVAAHRRNGLNVLLVGHSQGTMIGGQATGKLPGIEGHPVQVANSCVGAIALASPVNPSWYSLDENYVSGFIADHDIARLSPLSSGWTSVQTPFTDQVGKELSSLRNLWKWPYLRIKYGIDIHSVNRTYLSDSVVSKKVGVRLEELHSECVVDFVDQIADRSAVQNGDIFKARVIVKNKNGRELFGRVPSFQSFVGSTQLDSVTFRAMVPNRDAAGLVQVKGFYASHPISMPRVLLANPGIAETHMDGGWHEIGARNSNPFVEWTPAVPTQKWDGSFKCADAVIRVNGPNGGYVDYGIDCWTNYAPATSPAATIPSGIAVGSVFSWNLVDVGTGNLYSQQSPGVTCREGQCKVTEVWVDQYADGSDEPVASSKPQTDLATFSRLASTPALRAGTPAGTALTDRAREPRRIGNAVHVGEERATSLPIKQPR